MSVEAPAAAYNPAVLEVIEGISVASSQIPGSEATVPRRWVGLAAILAATLLNLLDSTVTVIAGPSIRDDLGGSSATLQWIAAAYTLALAVGLLVGGRLGDMFGRKQTFLVGVAGFLAASFFCAAAWSPESLITARALQGVFGAVMIPQSFGLIRALFGKDTGKAFGAFGPAIGLATIIGPVVGGLLLEWDVMGLGWRAIFAINVPLAIVAMVVGARTLPSGSPTARGERLDGFGGVIAAAAMFLLVYPLVVGREEGWPMWTFVALAASVPTFAWFVVHTRRRMSAGRSALVQLSVFKKRSYVAGVAFVLSFFGTCVGFGLAVGLFLQMGLGYSAIDASLAQVTLPIGAFVGTGFGAALGSKLGRTVLHIGLAVMTTGLLATAAVLTMVGSGVSFASLAAPLFLYGAGMGMIFIPLYDIIVAELEDHEVGSGSGILESFQQLGASLGVAVLGTIFFSTAGTTAASYVDASRLVTILSVVLALIAMATACFLPKHAKEPQW